MKNSEKLAKSNLLKKKHIFYLVFGILLLGILAFGISYAWLTFSVSGTKSNVLSAGSLQLKLDDVAGNGIQLTNSVPMSDKVGKQQQKYSFTLTNTGTVDSTYVIYLDDMSLSTGQTRMSDSLVKYYLKKNDVLLNMDLLNTIGTNPNRILDTGIIKPGENYRYDLQLWISQDTGNEVMGKVFKGKIRVEANQIGEDVLKGYVKNNLVLWYDGTDRGTSQTVWKDKSGNGNDGTLNNFSQNDASGFRANGLKFDGSDYVSMPNNPIYNDEQYTISLIVNFDNVSATQNLFCNRSVMGNGRVIFLLSSKLRIDNGSQWTGTYNLSAKQKQFITVSRSSTSIDVYVNGKLVDTTTNIGTTLNTHSGATTIGASQVNGTGPGNYLKGTIYDYKIYNRALTVQEINQNYQVSKTIYGI